MKRHCRIPYRRHCVARAGPALLAVLVTSVGLSASASLGVSPGITLHQVEDVTGVGALHTVTGEVRDSAGGQVPDGTAVTFTVKDANGAPSRGVVAGAPVAAMATRPTGDGYWLAGVDGSVRAFGAAPYLGDGSLEDLAEPVVGMVATGSGEGYWLITEGGRVLSFGDAPDPIDFGPYPESERAVAISRTSPTEYRVVTEAGRVLPRDAEAWWGDLPDNAEMPVDPIIGLASSLSGDGYWLYDASGRIYSFGDAPFRGSVPPYQLKARVAGMIAYGDGYLQVTERGGIFNFSNRPYLGSLGEAPPSLPVLGVLATPSNLGYWFFDLEGRVYPFGDAQGFGSSLTRLTASGRVSFSFTSLVSGSTTLSATFGSFPSAPQVAWLTQRWLPGPPAEIEVTARDFQGVVGTVRAVTARMTDVFGNAATDGLSVHFVASGTGAESPADGSAATAAGDAVFALTSTQPGSTVVTATADELVASVVIEWEPEDESLPATRSGYWMVGSDGSVYAFGDAHHLGNAPVGTAKAVDLEPTPSGGGYWVIDDQGHVAAFGDAQALGNVERGHLSAGETVTSLSSTPSGEGYWVFTTRGRVLTFGNAQHFGDMSGTVLNGPVLDSIPTPSGQGYYMVASDGGIFAFGDARFAGSMGGKALNAPVESLVPDGDGAGYWLVASDGGVFAFDAGFRGSMGGKPLNRPVTGMVPFGSGYLMVGEDGGIFNFSDREFLGSLGSNPPAQPIVSVAVLEEG